VASTNETDFRSVRLILHRPGVASYKKAPRPLKKHLEANVGAVRVSVVAQDEQRYEGNDALDLLKAHPHWNGGDRLPGRKRSQNTNKVTNIYQINVGSLENSRSFSYDANGNCLSDGIRTYHWDAENRLVSVTQGTNTYSFGYDYASRRVTEKLNGTLITQSVWDGQSLAEERNASNAVTKQFFAQGEVQSGSPFYYLRDHLGSVRELVNSSGAVQAEYTYDPYGNATTNQVSGTNVATFQYAGYYAHQGTGLDLTLYRAYDSVTGRWQSRDPLKNAEMKQGPNLYEYVHNRPLKFKDALGLLGGAGSCDPTRSSADQVQVEILYYDTGQNYIKNQCEAQKLYDTAIATYYEIIKSTLLLLKGAECSEDVLNNALNWYKDWAKDQLKQQLTSNPNNDTPTSCPKK